MFALLLCLAVAEVPEVVVWTGGSGDWSDATKWVGGLPNAESAAEVRLCSAEPRVHVSSAGGRAQGTLVLCEGGVLDISGVMAIGAESSTQESTPSSNSTILPPSPPTTSPPTMPDPQLDAEGGASFIQGDSAVILSVWAWVAIVVGFATSFLLALCLVGRVIFKLRQDRREDGRARTTPEARRQPDELQPPNSVASSKQWNGHV